MHPYLRRFAFHMWIEQRSSNQSNNIGKLPDAFSKVSCCYIILSSFKGSSSLKTIEISDSPSPKCCRGKYPIFLLQLQRTLFNQLNKFLGTMGISKWAYYFWNAVWHIFTKCHVLTFPWERHGDGFGFTKKLALFGNPLFSSCEMEFWSTTLTSYDVLISIKETWVVNFICKYFKVSLMFIYFCILFTVFRASMNEYVWMYLLFVPHPPNTYVSWY